MLKETKKYIGQNDEMVHEYDIVVDDVVVGGVSVAVYEEGAYIERIDIDEEYRNRGIGTEATKELAFEFCPCYAAPDNADSRRLLERLGEETFEDGWYGFDQGYGVYKL